MSKPKKTISLGQGLKTLVASLDKSEHLSTAGVIEVWEDVVGPEITQHTFVSGLKDGELLILVDSPVWATQLNAMAEQLRERITEESGQQTIRALRFTVSRRVSLERHEKQAEEAAERGYGGERTAPSPLTDSELEAIRKSVSGIENEGLREAAFRATVADLERKKGQEELNSAQAASGGLLGAEKAP